MDDYRRLMCWLRDEWSRGCLYAIYKCKHNGMAVCQLKGIGAPQCPGKCDAAQRG